MRLRDQMKHQVTVTMSAFDTRYLIAWLSVVSIRRHTSSEQAVGLQRASSAIAVRAATCAQQHGPFWRPCRCVFL